MIKLNGFCPKCGIPMAGAQCPDCSIKEKSFNCHPCRNNNCNRMAGRNDYCNVCQEYEDKIKELQELRKIESEHRKSKGF